MRFTYRLGFWLVLILAIVWLASCQVVINNPSPVLTGISPTHESAGQPQFTLTATGQQFAPSSVVEWKSAAVGTVPLTTTIFQSQTQLTATIPAGLIQNPGTASVIVFTPTPGGGTSAPQTFTIDAVGSPVPTITSISPLQTLAGGSGLTLLVTGTNFVSQSEVTVNNSNRTTNFVNSTSLQATIPSTDLGTAGTLQIAVINPPPGGGASNFVQLSVTNPFPSVGNLSPTSFQAGSLPTTLTVNGTGYVTSSQILINGTPRTTALSTPTALTTQLTSADLAEGGFDQVQVFNPGPGGGTSNSVLIAVTPTTSAGLPVLVDVAPDGTQANNGICGATCTGGIPDLTTAGPSSSMTGRFIAFASQSNNLVANEPNPASAIFLRDTCLGNTCTPTTFLVSAGASGGPANGPSSEPAVDSTATHAAYTSQATNLVTNVTLTGATRQIFWQQVCTSAGGCGNQTVQLVSATPDGLSPGNADSFNPAISPDGQYVAFVSLATNLVNGVTLDGVTPQVFLRNTCLGVSSTTCTPTTFLVSSSDGMKPGDGPSSNPAVAESGLYVSFTSMAKNLGAAAPNPGGAQEIFVRATCVNSANTCNAATNLVSAADPNATIPANGANSESAMTKGGRFVAFASTATNLGTNSGGVQQIYLRDTCIGGPSGCAASTMLVSTEDGSTAGNALSEHPSITQDGQFVAFASLASNLGGNTTNGIENIFVRDTCAASPTSCTSSTNVASHPGGTSPPPATGASVAPAVSGDGGTVSFLSFADNLVAHDTNGLPDIFLANAAPLETLGVAILGVGSGTVTDNLGEISCTSTNGTAAGICTANYARGSSVTLTATPKSGSTFGGWSGGVTSMQCPATGACTVTVNSNITVDATFN